MRTVERPEWNPGYCAVTGQATDNEGFIDTGNLLPVAEPRIYVSFAGVHQLARHVGYTDLEEVSRLRAQVDDLKQEREEYREELERLREFKQSVAVLNAHLPAALPDNDPDSGRPYDPIAA